MARIMEDKWALFSMGAFADFPEHMDRFGVFSLGMFTDESDISVIIGQVSKTGLTNKRAKAHTDVVRRPHTDIF